MVTWGTMTDQSRSIILAGSGRSGTTWLGNIIAANRMVRVIFEPFDHRRVPEASPFPLFAYARYDDLRAEWIPYARNVLSGNVQNDWVDRERIDVLTRRILVKEIRANLMLGWLHHNFGPRIVYITRHPCAVVLSRMRLSWQTHIDELMGQPQLVQDFLLPYEEIIRRANTDLQKQSVMWAIENLVPLSQISHYPWIRCTYEDFGQDPKGETRRLLRGLDMRYTPLTSRAIQKISRVTRSDSAVRTTRNKLSAWQTDLSTSEINEILTIVHDFGITLYDDDPMPRGQLLKNEILPVAAEQAL